MTAEQKENIVEKRHALIDSGVALADGLTRHRDNRKVSEAVDERTDEADRLLLVGAGAMAEGYLESAQRTNKTVAVVETAERLSDLRRRFPCIVDVEAITGPASADESWVSPAFRLFERTRPAGVLGFAEPQALAAAMVQDRNGLRGPGLGATLVSRNKALQRLAFHSAGLGQPAFLFVSNLAEGEQWVTGQFPVVVKALSGTGSAGVERIDGHAAWRDVVDRRRDEGVILVEEYVDGPEFSIEGLCRRGQLVFSNLTRKETTGAPFFVETAHIAAHGLDEPTLMGSAQALCAQVASVLGVDTGIVHLEFRARSDIDLIIMEVAVRTPGDHIMEIISIAHGFDFYGACIDLALGRPLQLPSTPTAVRSAGVVYLSADRPGVVRDIDLSGWASVAGLRRTYMMAERGDTVRPPESSSERLGYGVLECENAEGLRRAMDDLRSAVIVALDD